VKLKHAEALVSRLYKMDSAALRQGLDIDDDVDEIDEKQFIELMFKTQTEFSKKRFDAGFQKAQSETLGKLEKEIRNEFGIDDAELKGLDLVKHVTDSVKEEASKTAGKNKMTDDDVKKHPLYLELEKSRKKEIETIKSEYETKIKAEQDARQYEKTLTTVQEKAKALFAELGEPVLPEDKAVADRMIQKLLLDELSSGRKFEANGNDFIALKADGSRDEDGAGNVKTLKDIVAEIGKTNFQFKASQERKMPGNGGDPNPKPAPGKTVKYTGNAPKDSKEYVNLLTSPDYTPEQKSEIKQVFGPQFANG
jgi:hypothetical protein